MQHAVTKETLIREQFHVSHNKAVSDQEKRSNAAITRKDLPAALMSVVSVTRDPGAGMLIELSSGERAPRGEPNNPFSFAPHSTMTGFILTSAQPTRAAAGREEGAAGNYGNKNKESSSACGTV
ncbi:hypothetical protein Baya_8141 [Bagarius yarrelli]|uniref:Uncharacterized protein n=1 Tax=Bagarius yarrelli TaxID=175774 RepID=A0A556U5C1_BAGYA|nr:hypothetical protein Baya_8141 [Bagarius yarrelli]